MRVSILRNPGTELLAKLDASDRAKDLTEGAQVDIPDELANELAKHGIVGPAEVRGIPPKGDQLQTARGMDPRARSEQMSVEQDRVDQLRRSDQAAQQRGTVAGGSEPLKPSDKPGEGPKS